MTLWTWCWTNSPKVRLDKSYPKLNMDLIRGYLRFFGPQICNTPWLNNLWATILETASCSSSSRKTNTENELEKSIKNAPSFMAHTQKEVSAAPDFWPSMQTAEPRQFSKMGVRRRRWTIKKADSWFWAVGTSPHVLYKMGQIVKSFVPNLRKNMTFSVSISAIKSHFPQKSYFESAYELKSNFI